MRKINILSRIFLTCVIMLFMWNPEINAQLAKGQSKFLGNVIASSTPSNFSKYWNQVTPENAGKWGSVESTRDVMNWTALDNAYNYAKNNGFKFKLHTLIWGSQYPSWITSLTADEQKAEIIEWYAALAARYPNIDLIDVVNEPLKTTCPFKDAIGGDGTTGWDWVIWAFQTARTYFPSAILCINEYGIENDPTPQANYLTLIKLLKSNGLIDGIGIQGHCFNLDYTSASTLKATLDNFATTGLPVYISELDIRGVSGTNTEALQLQKYQELFPVMWEHSDVAGVTLWGYVEGSTWKTGTGILNSDGTERAAMVWLRQYFGDTTKVAVTGVTVSPSSVTININSSVQLTASVAPTNATNNKVSWSSNNTAVATVSSTGLVSTIAEGTAVITVTTEDQGKTASATIVVDVSASPCSNPVSTTLPITINGAGEYCYSTSGTISYVNSWNTDLVEINGTAYTNKYSSSMPATINGLYYFHYKASVSWAHLEVTGSSSTVTVTGVSVSPTTASIVVGGTTTLSATVLPANATNKSVTWSSSNTAIATVSTAGVVTGIGSGSATITVKTVDQSKTASAIVTVSSTIPITGIAISPAIVTLNVGSVAPLTVTITPSNATDKTVVWTSSNTSVATVGSTGIVAVGIGTATITCTAVVGGAAATVAVTVTGNIPVTGVQIAATNPNITVGATTTLVAYVTPTNATNQSVIWSSSNTDVATVSTNGVVTGVGTGSATITVTTVDQLKTATIPVTVSSSNTPVTGVTVSPATATICVTASTTLTATITPSDATDKSVTWSSSNSAIAVVSTAGVVTGIGVGLATITVTTKDQAKTASAVIAVVASCVTTCNGSNAVSITIPFSQNGSGEYCWSTTQEIAYVNSWNMDKVIINDVDYTNKWSNSIPAAINGVWYIYYVGSYAWSHFEAPALKGAEGIPVINTNQDITIYPNPADDIVTLESEILMNNVMLISVNGKTILTKSVNGNSATIEIGSLPEGLYILKIETEKEVIAKRLIIK